MDICVTYQLSNRILKILNYVILVIVNLCIYNSIYAQQSRLIDSLKLKDKFLQTQVLQIGYKITPNSFTSPSHTDREIKYDPQSRYYYIKELSESKQDTHPIYLTVEEYKKHEFKALKKKYWRYLTSKNIELGHKNWLQPLIINKPTFTKLFGGNSIEIIPRGNIDVKLAGQYTRNENPLINEKLRKQWGLDFDQNIQMNLTAKIGERALFQANFNSQSEFDFENQIRFDYVGKTNDIIKRIEIGNVNLSLPTTLIQGAESLFGLKVQLQYGKLDFTGLLAQKKSTTKEIVLNNGIEEGLINLQSTDYEANQHYFLAQYFRENYNHVLRLAPIINSPIHINQIEVWLSNKTNSYSDSRDILALLDLGESKPYNLNINSTSNVNIPSSAILNAASTEISNNLLQQLGEEGRLVNGNFVQSFFATSGATDNYMKLNAAKRLIENQEYIVNKKLGYISLQYPLNQDQVLAVAYRYTLNGKEYQVGEFSADIPVSETPRMLYTKLLKNEITKTNLPIWNLMMKNIYRLQGSDISEQNFTLQIVRTDDNAGTESPIIHEGQNTQNKTWLEVTALDRISQNNIQGADGLFDWIPDITIDSKEGRLVFLILEPFGKDLASKFAISEQDLIEKYSFPELYQLTRNDAEQQHSNKNRFRIQGKYSAGRTNEFHLGMINIQPDAIRVKSGAILLQEGIDYSVDYDIGLLRIINEGLLITGQAITVSIEENNTFNAQQKTLMGARAEYHAHQNLNLGATFMRLTEKPLAQKITIGNEPIANMMYGFDINYTKESKWLTKIVNTIAYIDTNESSYINFYGEFAKLNPSHPSAINNGNERRGTSYIDDFESNFTYIDIKSQIGWQIASTPRQFKEAYLSNDLAYGYNRALLALYNIDPVFYQKSPLNPKVYSQYLIDHRTRRITEKEVFPFKEVRNGTDAFLSTLDFAYYPMLRGPYNYSYTGILPNGNFSRPQIQWAGMFRKIEQPDFEAQNIDFLEMWLLDPELTNPNKDGGDIYINLGNISEDILKDGRKYVENGLSSTADDSSTDYTVWGKVAKQQPLIQAFENTEQSRALQDVGLDGLTNAEERTFFSIFLTRIQGLLEIQAFEKLQEDPSTDDYVYFRGNHFTSAVSILDRYKYYNGTEGNSRTSEQSLKDFAVEISSRTLQPDGEDINQDNNMNETDEYYQYKFSTRPQDMLVGKNFIVDEHISTIQVLNKNVNVKWYKIRIPLGDFESKEGNIEDFKSIRFIRMFLTNYADTAVLRFAKIQFVKGDWRKYNAENSQDKIIVDMALGNAPTDNSSYYVANINIEENGKRVPIPYVVPPGIERQVNYAYNNLDIKQNEQALSLQVINLKDGYGRAAYKIAKHDFRPYGRLEMYVHAEGEYLSNGDATVFIRIGTDDKYHYYEYEQPLVVTAYGTMSADLIWPEENRINIQLKYFLEAKSAREQADWNGLPWPIDVPYVYIVHNHKITLLGTPNLSNILFYMMGVKNPLRQSQLSPSSDNGSPISGEFWFNELRLTDYDEKGGWATQGKVHLKLADFANVALIGNKSTVGFGTLSQRLGERNRANNVGYDITMNIELGKLLHPKHRISIPFYFNFSKYIATPEYNPATPDIKLNATLSTLNNNKRDSLRRLVQDYTQRKSFSFSNMRKIRTSREETAKPWDIENIGLTFGYSEMRHRNFNIFSNLNRTYRAVIDYNYTNSSINFKQPFKAVKSENLAFIKNFTYNLIPSILNFRLDVNRLYRENTFRDNSNNNPLPTYYHKNFNINRIYGISWDITKSLRLDFNATNYSIVDEPNGRVDGAKLDTLWNNFLKMGRTTDYNHMMNITYNLPIDKLPYLDWITVSTRYGTQFNWQSNPLILQRIENINLGNSIQNNRTIQVNPTLNFNALYNKFKFIRNNRGRNAIGIQAYIVQLLTSVRHINAAYTKIEGTYLPGYLPRTNLIGYDFNTKAPGFSFLFGSQADILSKAIQNNWLTTDTLQNKLLVRTYTENLSGIIHLEPIKNMKIDMTFTRIHHFNSVSTIRYNPITSIFQPSLPYTTGNYSISQIALRSSFRKTNQLFQEFNQYKQEVSLRLAENNINSVGINKEFFADGYDKNQQDVVVNSFQNTYYKRKKIKPNRKPTFPLPNWRLNYTGLVALLSIEDIIQSIHIIHAYQSIYLISGYNSNSLYKEQEGMVYSRDYSSNFLPKLQYSAVSITDRFLPLIGVDMRFKNAFSINGEYRQARDINLSLQNSQLVLHEEKSLIIGMAYRKTNVHLPFGWYEDKRWKNDVNFKLEIAINDRKTSVFRTEIVQAEIAAGNKSITINPTLDYTINRYYTIRVFYNSNLVQPYTSQNYTTAYTYFGLNLRLQFH